MLPELPPVPALGVPADLLERRPDVRAARRRVEAADYRVAVAVADRLPALRLQGALSEQSGSIVDLIATPLYSLLASVTAPLFDHGRRRAEVDRNRAIVEERLADYAQAMLRAMVEVESALQQEPAPRRARRRAGGAGPARRRHRGRGAGPRTARARSTTTCRCSPRSRASNAWRCRSWARAGSTCARASRCTGPSAGRGCPRCRLRRRRFAMSDDDDTGPPRPRRRFA